MIFPIDTEHLRSLFLRFGRLVRLQPKTEDQYRSIIKLGGAILFVAEWYDIHNKNARYNRVWRYSVEVLSASFDITFEEIPKIIHKAEQHFSFRGDFNERPFH